MVAFKSLLHFCVAVWQLAEWWPNWAPFLLCRGDRVQVVLQLLAGRRTRRHGVLRHLCPTSGSQVRRVTLFITMIRTGEWLTAPPAPYSTNSNTQALKIVCMVEKCTQHVGIRQAILAINQKTKGKLTKTQICNNLCFLFQAKHSRGQHDMERRQSGGATPDGRRHGHRQTLDCRAPQL